MPSKRRAAASQAIPQNNSGRVLLYGALLIAAALIAYYNSFSGQFIIDDKLSIVQNQSIRALWPPSRFFNTARPLVDYTFAINYALGGLDPRGYHAFNLIVHILAGLTLFGLIRRTPISGVNVDEHNLLAFACTLLWIVHPLQTQAVTYIVQRSESMMGLFYLLVLYCLIRGSTSTRPLLWHSAGILASALGMCAKSVMLTAPFVALLYDRCFLSGSFLSALKTRRFFYPGLAASWLMLIAFGTVQGVFTKNAVDPITVGFGYAGVSPWQYFRTQPEILLHYLRLSLIPIGQCVDYGWPIQNNWIMWSAAGTVIVGLLTIGIWTLARRPPIGFLIISAFLILSPTSTFIPIRDLAFEHRMYLPLACVMTQLIFGAVQFTRGRTRGQAAINIATFTAVVLSVLFTLATVRRNQLYTDPVSLWSDTIRKADVRHARPHNALGVALLNSRRTDESIAELNKAVEIDPYYAGAYGNLGNAMLYKNNYESAVSYFQKALTISPYEFDETIHFLLGSALLDLKRYQEAETALNAAITIRPEYPEAWCNLGNVQRGLKKLREAESSLRKSISLRPDYTEALANLGLVLMDMGQAPEAIDAFSQALAQASTQGGDLRMVVQCNLRLADLYRAQGQRALSKAHYEAVLKIEPANAAAMSGLSTLTQP